ncbi:MAG: flagellar basal body P-ring protein FlgI, partial [Rhodocyclales bacterium]|nr:flagellar basal body P-ring protein FlgI [Rhodocyclales bacterium]
MTRTQKFLLVMIWAFAALLVADAARAERIKDLASVSGVRGNQLIGYGIVVGLDGSGDQTTQTPFTVQSIINMLSNMGVNLPAGTTLQLKNVAAVMVTATLPPFSRMGQKIDVTVSSIGNAKSLKGGTLVMTPLKGADGNVYALAQGNLAVAGAGASGGGSKVTVNHLSVGRIAGGATVEREVTTPVGQGELVYFELNSSDFGTVQRVAEAINRAMGPGTASAADGRQVRVRAPLDADERVS